MNSDIQTMRAAANAHVPQTEEQLAKMEKHIEIAFRDVLWQLSIDQDKDPNTQETAKRVAKMYVREIFAGKFQPCPKITSFPNTLKLDEIMTTGPILIRSTCSHHFCPIIGEAWIGILPADTLIGLSKFDRVVEWIASRPQIQEEMTVQIADELERLCKPRGLGVIIKAMHTCMTCRGVKAHPSSKMTTSVMRGVFRDNPTSKAEFLSLTLGAQ